MKREELLSKEEMSSVFFESSNSIYRDHTIFILPNILIPIQLLLLRKFHFGITKIKITLAYN